MSCIAETARCESEDCFFTRCDFKSQEGSKYCTEHNAINTFGIVKDDEGDDELVEAKPFADEMHSLHKGSERELNKILGIYENLIAIFQKRKLSLQEDFEKYQADINETAKGIRDIEKKIKDAKSKRTVDIFEFTSKKEVLEARLEGLNVEVLETAGRMDECDRKIKSLKTAHIVQTLAQGFPSNFDEVFILKQDDEMKQAPVGRVGPKPARRRSSSGAQSEALRLRYDPSQSEALRLRSDDPSQSEALRLSYEDPNAIVDDS